MEKYGFHSGMISCNRLALGKSFAITAGATPVIDFNRGSIFTLTPAENETITSYGGKPGQEVYLKVLTSGTNSYTLTFSTGFKVTGTLATGATTAKTFLMHFINVDGTFVEVSRTAAM